MKLNRIDMDTETYEVSRVPAAKPRLYIQRWNRCLWIMIVCLVFCALMVGTLIPGIVGLASGDKYKDTLIYLAVINFIFAGLFFTFWYSCQIETTDIDGYEREIIKKSVKRKGESQHHYRPKSLRSPLTSVSDKKVDQERSCLVEEDNEALSGE